MNTITFDVPTLYGDHHALRVQALLSALPGVQTVLASTAQRRLSVTYDPAQLSPERLEAVLIENGYPPGEILASVTAFVDEMHHVLAMQHHEAVPEKKYTPPPAFGVCPGLELRQVAGEHPADRH
jgi:copper chaperone CopZ